MIIADRLRELREAKHLSQDDIENGSASLLYLSRGKWTHSTGHRDAGENGSRHGNSRVQLFYDGEEPPKLPSLPKRKSSDDIAWGSSGIHALRTHHPSLPFVGAPICGDYKAWKHALTRFCMFNHFHFV